MKRFKMKKLAAIDIGSNAVRLLIANTYIENNNPTYKKDFINSTPNTARK